MVERIDGILSNTSRALALLWQLLRRYARLAGVVLGGVWRNVCSTAVDAYCAIWRRLAHFMTALCRKCLYPVELSAFDAADAVSARGSTLSSVLTVNISHHYASTLVCDPLLREPWFFPIDRKHAQSLVKKASRDGTFLVRPSSASYLTGTADTQCYCLTIYCKNRVYHIMIKQRRCGRFSLGEEKVGEAKFCNVRELVSAYAFRPLRLVSRGEDHIKVSTTLRDHPNRQHCFTS